MEMKKSLRGFTFFEVIIYLGIFSLMATALFSFSWDMIDLGTKDRTSREVFSDARMVSEQVKYLIRNASGVDQENSTWDDARGKLILQKLGTSDTTTIDIQNDTVTLTETGRSDISLHSSDVRVTELRFSEYGTRADASEYIGFTLTFESVQNGTRSPSRATTTIQGGAFIRNSGI